MISQAHKRQEGIEVNKQNYLDAPLGDHPINEVYSKKSVQHLA